MKKIKEAVEVTETKTAKKAHSKEETKEKKAKKEAGHSVASQHPHSEKKEKASKETPLKETVTKEATAKETIAKGATPKETVFREVIAKDIVTKENNSKEISHKEMPAKETSAKEASTKETSAKETVHHAVQKEKKEVMQSEINIGVIGHVDHGKCIASDELILLNGELTEAGELAYKMEKTSQPIIVSESERIYNSNIRAFSLTPDFSLISTEARVFVQNYKGPMIKIETKRGKIIKASPKHPLLVHNGLELEWKELQAIKTGDCVVALATIPDQDFTKDYGNDWKGKIEQDVWIIGEKEYVEIKSKTNQFNDFIHLEPFDWNILRILQGISISKLEKENGLSAGSLAVNMRKAKITQKQEKLLCEFFTKCTWVKPQSIIINAKSKSKCFCKINEPSDAFSLKMLRLLAFIIAEGHVEKGKILVAQSNNLLLEEIQNTVKEIFGVSFKFLGRFDYVIYNTALVHYLKARYDLRIGSARTTGIPEWIFTLPKQKLSSFLNMFFSAEAHVNKKTNQISLVQANKRSIEIISYSLKKFGIAHSVHKTFKCATNGSKKKREYFQLIISGTMNIDFFNKSIGFSLQSKTVSLQAILQNNGKYGKCSNEMVPFKKQQMMELMGLLGWKKHRLSPVPNSLSKQKWYWAYNDCYFKNAISKKNLEIFLDACKLRLSEMEIVKSTAKPDNLDFILGEMGSSWAQLARSAGITQKILFRQRKKSTSGEKQTIMTAMISDLNMRLACAKEIIARIQKNYSKNLEFDIVKTIQSYDYDGKIIDLQVPGYHNFVAGSGALICHNTSLTKALTGKWCDTHSEEMKRGISIRLGYADVVFYKLKTDNGIAYSNKAEYNGKPAEVVSKRNVSFVDAPGHETLMTTMLSGAALMNGAVLVIAANETCPQPRTIEHLMALKFAGVEKVVVAQNKVDLITKEQALINHKAIRNFLDNYGYKDAPIIPTAANFNANIDSLIEAIETHIPTPVFDTTKPLKMFIARSFDINKPGTKIKDIKGAIMGGSISQGTINVGDELELAPGIEGPTLTKVLSISTDHGLMQTAHPGGLIAIGTDLDPSMGQNDRLRGQIAGKVGAMSRPVKELKLKVNMFERMLEQNIKEKTIIKVTDPLVITIGTNTAVGFVVKADLKSCVLNLKNEVIAEKNEKVALSKNIAGQWRLIAFGEVQ